MSEAASVELKVKAASAVYDVVRAMMRPPTSKSDAADILTGSLAGVVGVFSLIAAAESRDAMRATFHELADTVFDLLEEGLP